MLMLNKMMQTDVQNGSGIKGCCEIIVGEIPKI